MSNNFDDFRNRKRKLLKEQEEKRAAQALEEAAKKKSTVLINPMIIPQFVKQEMIIQKEPIDSIRLLPNGKKLPTPFEPNELKNLVRAINSLSDLNEKKGRVYEIVLESALANTKPLLELYSLIPQIWSGSSSAISDFKKIIEQSSKYLGFRPESLEIKTDLNFQKLKSMSDRLPSSSVLGPCGPIFFIKPDVIHNIQESIYFIAGENSSFLQNSMAIVSLLWKNAQIVDTLNVLANSPKGDSFSELSQYMDQVAQTYGLEGNLGKIEEQRIKANRGNLGPLQGPLGGTWFPPEPGFPFPPLGPNGGPGFPGFPRDCQPIRDYCQDVLTGPSTVYRGEMPVSVSSSGIRRISATSICGGYDVIIEGAGFGNLQGNRGVVFGTKEGIVKSWSDGIIVVEAPADFQGTVCIGLIDRDKENRRKEIHKINQKAFGQLVNAAGPCLSMPSRISGIPYKQDSPVCFGVNQIAIGKPIIRLFNINNAENSTVESGSDLIMKWIVGNADSIRFSVDTNSSPKNFPSGNSSSGIHRLGTLSDRKVVVHTYTIEAKNSCGTSTAEIKVTVTGSYKLNILGIEATQAIQKFDWNDPVQNNSVFLVSNKLTMVRVYPENVLKNGFDFGKGPNIIENVEAKLKVKYSDGQVANFTNNYDPLPAILAGSKSDLNRENLSQSFNFILPAHKLDGTCELTAEIVVNPRIGAGSYSKASTSVTFKKTQRLKLALILVNDTINGLPAPTQQDFDNTFNSGKGRIPVGDTNFTIYIPTNHREISTQSITYYIPNGRMITIPKEDLKTENGWSNLLDRLDDIADDYNLPEEVIWAGLVPRSRDYYANGMANSGFSFLGAFWHKRLLNQNGLPATFMHELVHTLEIGHAASVDHTLNNYVDSCKSPDGVDNNLISLIEDLGVDVDGYKTGNTNSPHVLPKGVPSLMSYCVPIIGTDTSYQNRWISIDLWNRLKNYTY
jgi:hypothetical protein